MAQPFRPDDAKLEAALVADPAARHVGLALISAWELTRSHVVHGLVASWAYKLSTDGKPNPTREDVEQFIQQFKVSK